jgi:hypothetical protein
MVAKLMVHIDLSSSMPLSKRGFTTGNLAQALILVGSQRDSGRTQLHVGEYVELSHAH